MTLLHREIEGRLDEILGGLAEELINYDKRMDEAKAPEVRFVYKYNKAAKTKIIQLLEAYTKDRVKEAMRTGYYNGGKPVKDMSPEERREYNRRAKRRERQLKSKKESA